MSDDKKQLTRSDTALRMDRAEAIKFKLMPDGHIRAFQSNTPDLRGISELQIYPPRICSPTITVAHCPKLLIADEAIYRAIQHAILR